MIIQKHICVVLFLLFNKVYSANTKVFFSGKDTLAVNDTTQAKLFFNLGYACSKTEKAKADVYFNKAELILDKLKNDQLKGELYYYKASFYAKKLNDYSVALDNINQSIELSKKSRSYQVLLNAYNLKSFNIYQQLSLNRNAIETLKEALKYSKIINSKSYASNLYWLGWFEVNSIRLVDSGLVHLYKSYSLSIKDNNMNLATELLTWIGNAYNRKKDYKKSLKYILRSATICDSLKLDFNKYDAYRYAAYNYLALNKKDSAILLLKSYENYLLKAKGEPNRTYHIGGQIIKLLLKEKPISEVEDYVNFLDKNIDTAYKPIDIYMQDFVDALFLFYNKKQDYKKAIKYLIKYNQLRDLLQTAKYKANLEVQELKYEYNKKIEKQKLDYDRKNIDNLVQIKNQQTQKYFAVSISIFVFILLVVSIKSIREKKQSNKEIFSQKLELEKQNKVIEEKNDQLMKQNLKIEDNLNEKNTLLKEIHHRVKNNLQLISGLLGHQSSNSEEALKANYEVIKLKINAISIIHENFYRADNLSFINMDSYINQLNSNIFSLSQFNSVQTFVKATDIILDIETATPVGLIINELITNSIKHAFANSPNNRITIEIAKMKTGVYKLTYCDNGSGYNPLTINKGLGLELIELLVKQLNGRLNFLREEQFHTIIEFDDKEKRREIP